ncbi:MAG TPA: class I SAM-dependent methyltransferase [Pyrinomonadaceae bacterium]|nr:class I SAM-dependent methyltransferase [Pyrinomonadaceae bacterium]
MNEENLTNTSAEFEKLKPWVTKFHIEGKDYGGNFDALNDVRIGQFFDVFPKVKSVIELGSLEGGHSFALAKSPVVEKVLAVEGREKNIEKAKLVQDIFGDQKVEFVQGDIEKLDFQQFGTFDAVFCSGLLYHLPKPWELIPKLARVSPNIFIWTQISEEAKAKKMREGWRGKIYREGGFFDPLSGLSKKSFWLSLGSLIGLLTANGYREIKIIEHNLAHPNGAAVTLAATKDKFKLVKN